MIKYTMTKNGKKQNSISCGIGVQQGKVLKKKLNKKNDFDEKNQKRHLKINKKNEINSVNNSCNDNNLSHNIKIIFHS